MLRIIYGHKRRRKITGGWKKLQRSHITSNLLQYYWKKNQIEQKGMGGSRSVHREKCMTNLWIWRKETTYNTRTDCEGGYIIMVQDTVLWGVPFNNYILPGSIKDVQFLYYLSDSSMTVFHEVSYYWCLGKSRKGEVHILHSNSITATVIASRRMHWAVQILTLIFIHFMQFVQKSQFPCIRDNIKRDSITRPLMRVIQPTMTPLRDPGSDTGNV
jgi:hypothetical protein